MFWCSGSFMSNLQYNSLLPDYTLDIDMFISLSLCSGNCSTSDVNNKCLFSFPLLDYVLNNFGTSKNCSTGPVITLPCG